MLGRAHVSNELQTSVCRSDDAIRSASAKCSVSLSNGLNAIKAASSEVVPSAKSEVCNETSESAVNRSSKSSIDSIYDGSCSS